MSQRASRVKSPLGHDVRGVSRFGGCVKTEVSTLTAYLDARLPLAFTCVPCDAKKSALAIQVCSPLVLGIERTAHISQVANPVVAPNPVLVVDLVSGPFASHVEPSEPVGQVGPIVNLDRDVPILVNTAGQQTLSSAGPGFSPRKYACLLGVVKNLVQARSRKIGSSHEAVLSLIGQRPAGVDVTALASQF